MKTEEHFSIATTILSDPCLNELFLNAKNEMIKVREQLRLTKSRNSLTTPLRLRPQQSMELQLQPGVNPVLKHQLG